MATVGESLTTSPLRRLRRWLSARRATAAPATTFGPTTQVGRRALKLGLIETEFPDSSANQVEQQERRLLQLHGSVSDIPPDGTVIAHRLSRLRTAIVEVLEEPDGLLGRSLRRHWPERSSVDREALAALIESMRSLADDAEELLAARREVRALRDELRRLEHRYAGDVPSEWRRAVVEARLQEVIDDAWSRDSVDAIKHDVQMLAEFFESRCVALRSELQALRPSGGGPIGINEGSDTAGLEARVTRFSELARQRIADKLDHANEMVAVSSADHLAHLGKPLIRTAVDRVLSSKELEQREVQLRQAGDSQSA